MTEIIEKLNTDISAPKSITKKSKKDIDNLNDIVWPLSITPTKENK